MRKYQLVRNPDGEKLVRWHWPKPPSNKHMVSVGEIVYAATKEFPKTPLRELQTSQLVLTDDSFVVWLHQTSTTTLNASGLMKKKKRKK